MAVSVSRRIAAPAGEIFRILTDPGRHTELDGSGMLRGAVTTDVITGVGDVFVMKMYYAKHGDYQMNNHVIEFVQDQRIAWAPVAGHGHPNARRGASNGWGHQWSFSLAPDGPDATVVTESYDCSRAPEEAQTRMEGGGTWLPGMARTLEVLDQLCCQVGAEAL